MARLIDKVKELRGKLMSFEMELNILESDYVELTRELRQLSTLEDSLIYNINFLRKDKIVAVASEYSKSIKQLEEVKKRILKYNSLKSIVGSKMREAGASYDHYKQKFESAFNELENEQVILMFNRKSRKKKGGDEE